MIMNIVVFTFIKSLKRNKMYSIPMMSYSSSGWSKQSQYRWCPWFKYNMLTSEPLLHLRLHNLLECVYIIIQNNEVAKLWASSALPSVLEWINKDA